MAATETSHEEPQTKTLTAHCFCKAVHFSVTFPVSAFPLPVRLCHCSICRYTHGTLNIFHADLPRDVEPDFIAPSSRDSLTGYKHDTAAAERVFCSTCGCHVGDVGLEGEDKGQWVVATSLFPDHGNSDLFQIKMHCFTESAPNGLYEWLPKVGDRDVRVWNPPADSKQWPVVREPAPKQEFDENGNEVLRAQCHCGGVSFTVPRPTVPGIKEDAYLSQFVSPADPTKWLAVLDACDDCRLVTGTHCIAWAFVPRVHTSPPIPETLVPFGTLKLFESSPGVQRAFCGVCGATVIFTCDARKPSAEQHVLDISVGILRAPEGPLAEKWLTWRAGRLAWADSGKRFDHDFAESLGDGLKKWSLEKYGDAPTREVG